MKVAQPDQGAAGGGRGLDVELPYTMSWHCNNVIIILVSHAQVTWLSNLILLKSLRALMTCVLKGLYQYQLMCTQRALPVPADVYSKGSTSTS